MPAREVEWQGFNHAPFDVDSEKNTPGVYACLAQCLGAFNPVAHWATQRIGAKLIETKYHAPLQALV